MEKKQNKQNKIKQEITHQKKNAMKQKRINHLERANKAEQY